MLLAVGAFDAFETTLEIMRMHVQYPGTPLAAFSKVRVINIREGFM